MRALTALALTMAIASAGCGKRGDPLPPLLRIPASVNSPRVSQQGQDIVIVWETPTATVDGGALELAEAEVLRRVVEPSSEAPPDAPTALPFEAGEETTSGETLPADVPVEGEPPPEAVGSETAAAEEMPFEEAEQEEETDEDTVDAGTVLPSFASTRQEGFASEAEVIARIECHEPGERLEYRDSWDPEWEGMRVEYAVRHVNSKGRRSESSNRRSIEPLPPLPTPSELKAVADNGFVRLAWSPSPNPGVPATETTELEAEPEAATSQPESPAEIQPETQVGTQLETQPSAEPTQPAHQDQLDFGYNVYRRRKGAESYPARALNRRLLETTGFEDREVAFGRDWCYTVRRVAVRRAPESTELPDELPAGENAAVPVGRTQPEEGAITENIQGRRGRSPGEGGRQQPPQPPALIESAGAEEVCLTPIDTFAPPVPEDVVALGVPGGILLSWSESPASDLQGYRVYRAVRRDGPFELLTLELLDVPSLADRDASPGRTYFYTVSALDDAQPPNESPRSEVVGAQARE